MGTNLLWNHRKPRAKGQALVEFALVFPIFLLLVLGVIELAHLMFIFSSVYVSSREAARYGAAAGINGSVAYYRDCAGMRAAAQRVGEYGGVKALPLGINASDPTKVDPTGTGVAIQLIRNGQAVNQAIDFNDCSWVDPDPEKLITVGDRIRVTTQVQFEPIVPLVPFPAFAVSHTSTRTILKDVSLEKIEAGSPPVADTYGVVLSVPDDSIIGPAGTEVTYNLSVKNTGSIFDTYTLVLTGNNWTTTLDTAVSVVPGETVVLPVVVNVPTNAGHHESDIVTITATSIGDPGVPPASDNLSLTTVAPDYGVDLTVPDNTLGGLAGTNVTYNLSVRNTGDLDDTFTLTLSGNNWATTIQSPVDVAAGQTVVLPVAVTIPTEFTSGANDTVTITAESVNDPINPPASDTISLTTSAPFYAVALSAMPSALSGRAGTEVTYSVNVRNNGNVVDQYNITASGNIWAVSVTSSSVTLDAGRTQAIEVKVLIPPNATHGDSDRVNILAVSVNDPTTPPASATLELITTAFTYGVELSADPSALIGAPGETVTFNVNVKNIGTVNDGYALTISGNTWTTTVPCAGSATVAAGASVICPVQVTVPNPVAGGAFDRVTITAVSQGDPSIPPASTSLTLRTTTPRYGVMLALTVPDDSLSGAPGKSVTYTLTIRNTGNVNDTFGLTLSGNGWQTAINPTSVTLNAGQSKTDLIATVTIPSDALHDAIDVVTVTAYSGDIAAPRATASLTLTTTATRVCPYAGALGLGTKSMNLLLYNNSLGAEAVTVEQINVTWYINNANQRLDYITYLGSKIMDTDVTGTVNTSVTSSFPANGPWIANISRGLPAGASNYGLNVYFGTNIDTTKIHGLSIRFSNGCFISR